MMDAHAVELFDPGTPVFTMMYAGADQVGGGRQGKVVSSWIDLLTRKVYVNVKWADSDEPEVVLGDWIREEPQVTDFSADPTDKENKPKQIKASIQLPPVEEVVASFRPLSTREVEEAVCPLGDRMISETGASEERLDAFLAQAKYSMAPDGAVVANVGKHVVRASFDDAGEVTSVIYIRSSKVVRASEFFKGGVGAMPIEIIAGSGHTYVVKIGGEAFEMGRAELEEWADDYNIDLAAIDAATLREESYQSHYMA